MNIGAVVEYIDQQKIISAVILSQQKGKLRLLNENSREVNFSENRLSHIAPLRLDTAQPRTTLVNSLKEITENRKKLSEAIDIRELWEILHEESGDIDISAMTLFCFDPPLTPDHEAAVIRAFFKDRLYFKFNKLLFAPYTPDQVKAKKRQIEETEKKEHIIQKGIQWLTAMSKSGNESARPDGAVLEILKSYYLFGSDSNTSAMARQMIKKSGLTTPDPLFNYFVRCGIWDTDENLDLLTLQVPTRFSDPVMQTAKKLSRTHAAVYKDPCRKDLTHLPLVTIDGQSTLDYDDAISLESTEGGYCLGIHIIDVGAYIKSGDPIDMAARQRGSSIYMPDDKLPMIPSSLSEDLCSLRQDELRPGISTLIQMNRFFEVRDYKIVPSIIKVHQQMSYTEANLLNGKNDPITSLYKIATLLREKRLKAGAIQITLPEVNVWLEENREIRYSKVDRENPSRMLVSEMMIFANSLMAKFLADNEVPAVFRSQAPPKQRLFSGIELALMPNFMQRKQLSRAVIGTTPESHSGLGVKAYVTATSPIRRYHDLLTQRQIKAILGFGQPYSKQELDEILQTISIPMVNAGRIQGSRKRYWLIKYLESVKGQDFEALVLERHRDYYNILIKEFMLEARMPASGYQLKSGDLIQVAIQHADARRNQLSLFPA
ncbi:ribonuclease catalytic domain-containing protein [Desulfospira joergensenii]|uniref:ribonuclease catalytic domain-containing protein n=1 Tax=Desulfospira joergensenii TaxID=53329 RepID=UPI0003B6899F|nr:RNB domain-containing ribonuclease [Desulfospira joergensenii]